MWNGLAGSKAVKRVKRRWSFLWAKPRPVLTDGDRKTAEALWIRKEACGKGLRETPGQASSPAGTNWAAQPPSRDKPPRLIFYTDKIKMPKSSVTHWPEKFNKVGSITLRICSFQALQCLMGQESSSQQEREARKAELQQQDWIVEVAKAAKVLALRTFP